MIRDFFSSLRLRLKGVPWTIIRAAGPGFYCGRHAFFRRDERIFIGKNVFMGNHVHIAAPCEIKDDVMLASYVAFVGGDHAFSDPGCLINGSRRSPAPAIVIEEDVWIGHGSIIRSGVRVGRGSIIAAGSVVTRDVPPCSIWGSPPAQLLRPRFASLKEQACHLAFLKDRYGDLPP